MPLSRNEEVKSSSTLSDGTNVRDQVEKVIFETVQNIADASIPRVSQVADLALQINRTLEKQNKHDDELRQLATDARDLMYVILPAVRTGVSPPENLDHVTSVLLEVRQYVEGVVWGNIVLQQADLYRKRLKDCLARFGVQENLDLQNIAHKKAQQALELHSNKVRAEPSDFPSPSHSSPIPESGGGIAYRTRGDIHVSNVTNTDSCNTYVNSSVSRDNTSVTWVDGNLVEHDNSVQFGQGVSFEGAYAFTFGGEPDVTANCNITEPGGMARSIGGEKGTGADNK